MAEQVEFHDSFSVMQPGETQGAVVMQCVRCERILVVPVTAKCLESAFRMASDLGWRIGDVSLKIGCPECVPVLVAEFAARESR